MTRIASILLLIFLVGATAGCNAMRPPQLRNTGLSDRCAAIMRQSYPGGDIRIVARHATISTTRHGNLGLLIADVEGVRPDIPATGGFLARDVAARCRFQNGILVEFRWTKGPFR